MAPASVLRRDLDYRIRRALPDLSLEFLDRQCAHHCPSRASTVTEESGSLHNLKRHRAARASTSPPSWALTGIGTSVHCQCGGHVFFCRAPQAKPGKGSMNNGRGAVATLSLSTRGPHDSGLSPTRSDQPFTTAHTLRPLPTNSAGPLVKAHRF